MASLRTKTGGKMRVFSLSIEDGFIYIHELIEGKWRNPNKIAQLTPYFPVICVYEKDTLDLLMEYGIVSPITEETAKTDNGYHVAMDYERLKRYIKND